MEIYEFLRTFSSPFPVVALLATRVGSKPRTAAKGGTMGYAQAFRRAALGDPDILALACFPRNDEYNYSLH